METYLGLEYFLNPHKRIFWVFILSSLIMALVYQRKIGLKGLFSKSIWWHPSAKLDYMYFVVMVILKIVLIVPLLLSATHIALEVNTLMHEFFGFHETSKLWGKWSITLLYTLSVFLVSDFTRYLLHRAMHEIKFLWRFHKVHHSAKVLNPFTLYRVHPVENVLFGLRYALSVGFVTGMFLYWFKSYLGLYQILGVNVIAFMFMLFGSNLRHSHIPLGFYRFIEWVVISPKMHQIHHSKHSMSKNYGGYLSIWDHIFKTSSFSTEFSNLEFGLNHKEMKYYQSLRGLFFTPLTFKGKIK